MGGKKLSVSVGTNRLTFKNVALSFVTIDGLTLMLSCIIDVKLQDKK